MAKQESLPNILLFITHDTGRHFGCYDPILKTPNIDQLAKNGVIFTNHFCTAPQCSPSRGSLLTGKMPHSNGLMGLVNEGWDLPTSNKTLPELLEERGYSTHLIGLQHEHLDAKELGYQTISDRDDFPYISNDVGPKVMQFIDDVENDNIPLPFFCSVGFFETHIPFIVSDEVAVTPQEDIKVPDYLPDSSEIRETIAEFQAAVASFDRTIGAILERLNDASFAANTLIIFTVDHGWPFPRAKCTLYDPGIGTALIMRWPNRIEGGKIYSELVSNIDLLPTLLELTETSIPEDIEGKSFYHLLFGGEYQPRDHIFVELTHHDIGYNPMRGIRTKRWKYIRNFAPLPVLFEIPNDINDATPTGEVYRQHHPEYNSPRPQEELYDLENDPNELKNLATEPEFSQIKEKLRFRLIDWLQKTDDPILQDKVDPPIRSKNMDKW